MAEQISHNVVINTESASGSSPLADVASNHNITPAIADGTQHVSTPITTDETASTKSQNSDAAAANGSLGVKDMGDDAVQPAAEPSAGDAAEQPAEPAAVETPAQDKQEDSMGSASDPLPNGVHGESAEDTALHDTSADPSVHSDTETSRADAADASKDDKRHVRRESVKKATTFSRVSVSKSFLAKSSTPVPAAAKGGEKAAPASTAASAALKPRLIAKTGASLIAQKARQNSDTLSGPDANKVWNKNRPTAPAPPKQFTDEELKQQYGIHLATRLQSDGEGKENKWADIDDEDDDWVPETVVWMDGTKTNLTPADATPVQKEAELAVPPYKKPVEIAKPMLSIASKQNAPAGPPKTILRPGIAKTASNSTSNTGAEKATLKAKSPVATAVKSPWASIPKVDTVPLVNPPTQYHAAPTPFATQDARAYEQAPPSGPPLPEMAPDAFDRTLRSGDGRQRELFNSTNGRFEPAAENRRASRGSDSYTRKPALLQRPSQASGGPAEPSAAFQTRTSSQTDGPPSWARRRGSSVSQASGPPGRRMSTTRSHEPVFAAERRSSTITGQDPAASPKSAKHEPVAPAFAQQNAWSQQMPPPPPAGAPVEVEDAAKLQEKIMKEKKEASTKMREKRMEDDRLAEEARKARLAAKLAELGGAGMSRSEREAAAVAAKAAAEQKAKEAVKPAAKAHTASERPSSVADLKAAAATSAPQTATTPTAVNDVTSKAQAPDQSGASAPSAKVPGLTEPTSSTDQTTRLPTNSLLSPALASRAPGQQQQSLSQKPAFPTSGDQKQQTFPSSTSDIFTAPWPTAGSGNVWGSSGALGNGTFAPTLSGLPQIPNNMSRPPTSARISPQGLGQDGASPALTQPPGFGDSRPITANSLGARPDHFMAQSRANGTSPTPGLGRQQHVPGPIAPPSRAQPNRDQRPDDRAKASGWNSYAVDGPQQYARAAEAAKATVAEAGPPTVLRETFKQTSAPSRLGGKRGVDKVQHLVHDADGSRSVPAPPSTQTQPAATSTASASALPAGENTVRLPGAPAQQPLRAQRQAPSLAPLSESKEQSPPPPDAASHPVNAGDAKHPHVRLPRPAPVVKLPPASPHAGSAVAPPAAAPIRNTTDGRARPLVESDAWKERFNVLFNRATIQTETPPSPPGTPPKANAVAAAAVSSSTRTDLDVAKAANATVSLPQPPTKKFQFTVDSSSEVTSKPSIDNMFNEELGFGSRPRTRVPRNTHYHDMRFSGRVNLLHMGTNWKLNMGVEATTRDPATHLAAYERDGKGCHVNMIGVKTRYNPIFWRNNRSQNVRPGPKSQKGKGSLGPAAAKEGSATSSPASKSANSTPAPGSRKTSFQKAPASKEATNTAKPDGVATGESSTEAPKERSGGWARPPRGPKRDLRPTGFVLPLQTPATQQS
ncbi:hypothetical protein B0A48_16360 [Cryoendolithus antarcticus]|uniref:Uncharacterized protein n=1 Tax=Cryoendolithus antarcticus TaxID=1507870 RepID=A0A1V8SDR5_9PEZI|nr:hypothetical protein B0A48_16360 [Cryoendolithus antarcticus]